MNLTRPQKLLAAGKHAEAEAALPSPGKSADPRVELIRARIRAESGNRDDAAVILQNIAESRPDFAPAHLFNGINLWDTGKVEDAQDSFGKVLNLQKTNDLARSYLALCLLALGQDQPAANLWREHGFSDNAMYRVRVAEFVELEWLHDQDFMGECEPEAQIQKYKPSLRKALRQFYRRNFTSMLAHLPGPGTDNELEAFLAATGHEMLKQYSVAQSYLDPLIGRRVEWPEPLIALNARLKLRRGEIAPAAREFAEIVVMGPEDFGINYYMGVVFLAYGKREEARQHFLRAFTNYMVDTLEFQWWQIEQALLKPPPDATIPPPAVQAQ